MKHYILSLIILLFGWTGIVVAENASVLFILDGSGSMKAKIDEQEKMTIAKVVISNLIQELPNDIKMGLAVYGHRSKGDCNDIELMSPMGQGNKATLVQRIQSIEPKGKTPITQSLMMAGEQLQGVEEQTTVVLVSDGEETCAGDPCAAVRSLMQQGIKFKVHVVGFDVTDKEKQQLVCIADAGGGKYFGARNADQLKGALAEVKKEVVQKIEVKPQPVAPEKKIIKIAGPGKIEIPNLKGGVVDVYEQQAGKKMGIIYNGEKFLHVPPGTYKLKFGDVYWEGIEVASSEAKQILVGTIEIPNLKGEVVDVYEQQAGKKTGIIYSGEKFLHVPPGTYKLQAGNLYTLENIAVEAGQEVVIEQ